MPFEPLPAAAGGLLIGLAASLLLLGNGRVAGISGILGAAIAPGTGDERRWRWAFLLGLPLGACIHAGLARPEPIVLGASPAALVAAGLLVGFGTQLASGCTSGHGVCGIARGARRSVAATAIFMATAFAVVAARRLWLGGI